MQHECEYFSAWGMYSACSEESQTNRRGAVCRLQVCYGIPVLFLPKRGVGCEFFHFAPDFFKARKKSDIRNLLMIHSYREPEGVDRFPASFKREDDI
jgi:hypothetical protein